MTAAYSGEQGPRQLAKATRKHLKKDFSDDWDEKEWLSGWLVAMTTRPAD